MECDWDLFIGDCFLSIKRFRTTSLSADVYGIELEGLPLYTYLTRNVEIVWNSFPRKPQ
jgi:hypothetical protein